MGLAVSWDNTYVDYILCDNLVELQKSSHIQVYHMDRNNIQQGQNLTK